MSNAKMTVSAERWKGMDENERAWLIYDTLVTLDRRITSLEKRGWIHKSLAFAGGVIGGMAVFLGFKWGGIP